MVLSFPLSYDTFWDTLLIQSASFYLPEALETSRTAGGEVFAADMAARLWSADIQLAQRLHDNQAPFEVMLSILREAGRSFQAGDVRRKYPAYDPDGIILGTSSPVLSSVAANSREITISGLPVAYQISQGDFLSFAYGSSPTRQALHRVVVGKTANGSGIATDIEVTPHIRPGASLGAAIQLVKPWCKMQIVPGSFRAGMAAKVQTSGAGFRIMQTLR